MPRIGAAAASALLLLLGSTIVPTMAAEPFRLRTTGDLQALCDPQSDAFADIRLAQCNGFIAGTGLLYLELVEAGTIERWACAPQGTGLAEVRDAFVSWAGANPSDRETEAVDGFWEAMAETWPCNR